MFFCFKQKTAYEMRISDWSSDVCSSDLFNKLAEKVRRVLLHGSGDERIEFRYPDERGRVQKRSHKFEGIVPNLERRYRETESDAVREELAKYLSNKPCPAGSGQRLNRPSRQELARASCRERMGQDFEITVV